MSFTDVLERLKQWKNETENMNGKKIKSLFSQSKPY